VRGGGLGGEGTTCTSIDAMRLNFINLPLASGCMGGNTGIDRRYIKNIYNIKRINIILKERIYII